MCQSIAQGGRRCAAHHPGTLAMKNILSKSFVDLQKGQVDYIFKATKKEGRGRRTPSQATYERFFNEAINDVNNGNYSDEQKTQLITKLEAAKNCDQLPDGSTFYAWKKMYDRGQEAYNEMSRKCTELAERTGKRRSTVLRNFKEAYSHTVAPHGDADVDYGNVLDPRSMQAWEALDTATEPRREETPRITRIRNTGSGMVTVRAYGYDPEDGRLEIEISNNRGSTNTYAFHSVEPELYETFRRTPVATFREICNAHQYNYSDQQEAEQDAYRVWCDNCHRFRLASGHVCDDANGRTSGRVVHYDVDEIYGRILQPHTADLPRTPQAPAWRNPLPETVDYDEDAYVLEDGYQGSTPTHAKRIMPDADKLTAQLREGKPVVFKVGRRIYVAGTGRREWNDVTDTVTARPVQGNHFVTLTRDQELKCTCDVYQRNGRCTHTHPGSRGRANRFANEDVNIALNAMMVESNGIHIVPSAPFDRLDIIPDGENGQLSQAQLDGMLYEFNNSASIRDAYIRIPGTDRERTIHVEFDANGHMTVRSPSRSRAEVRAIMDQINGDNDIARSVNRRLLAASRIEVNEGWDINRITRDEYLSRFGDHTNGYLRNPEQFVQDYHRALEASANGIPFISDRPVTGGLLSNVQGVGRGFGVEVELDGSRAAINEVARRMHREGLSTSDQMHGYHARNNYQNWRMEHDGSVTGEVVSPILYDTPESWQQLQRVCEIARESGAIVTTHTGNHIHIGSAGMDTNARRGVLTAVVANQDVIRRLATDPARGTHRTNGSSGYSAPFSNRDIQAAYSTNRYGANYGLQQDRYRMANFHNQNTIEFRDCDGSLNPGHIQANVLLNAGLMAAGEHGRWGDLNASNTHMQRVGTNAMRETHINTAIQDEDERIIAGNISLMTSLDALFPEREQRQTILNAIARTPWQRGNRSY